MLGKGAHAPLAQHDLIISFSHNVFGCQEPFLQCGSHPALEQDRQFRTTDSAQKRVVLHVARANLNHVGIFFDQIDTRFVESLANDF